MDNFRRSIISHPTNLNNLLGGGSDSEPSDFYNPNPNYLTIVALEDGSIEYDLYDGELLYSVNGSDEWIQYEYGDIIDVCENDYISFKSGEYACFGRFYSLPMCNLTGNCNSILFGDDANTNFDLTGHDSCYEYMFVECPIIEVSPTFLPATTLAENCYFGMFQFCTSLETAPVLPATTLAKNCYEYMFVYCISLTTAPELPATTLADYCYRYMFQFCISLTTAPILPATTLASYCYSWMFSGCTSLTTAPELPATTLVNNCYESMFYNCTSLTTAPELPATTLADSCYSWMFGGCASLTTAPELPATTLADDCYDSMFYDCSKLNYIKAMFTTTPSSSYTSNWVRGVASSGTFIKNKNATWNVTGNNGIPSGWTVVKAVVLKDPYDVPTHAGGGTD